MVEVLLGSVAAALKSSLRAASSCCSALRLRHVPWSMSVGVARSLGFSTVHPLWARMWVPVVVVVW
ncbi:hypothetical protein, partial [uncultured Actinomyces sp.]|uniref:hypothetical protein n=1 Tax=uncultured Actinomyces sp. TaxID=249061 RepID=UPI0028895879